MKLIFHKGPPLAARISFFIFLAVLVFWIDSHTNLLKPVRQGFMTVSTPLYWFTSLPSRLTEWGGDKVVSRETLQSENAQLRAENRVLQQKLQKMVTVVAENARLTELLNSSHELDDDVLIAKLIGVSPDTMRQAIMLDKGSDSGVYVGQAVLDANGVAGLVTETSTGISRIMLITDSRSAIPVQIMRNGIRLVSEGTGRSDQLLVRHVTATIDITEGDTLISSGLDRHYPANYPVAKVTHIEQDPGQPFLIVKAEPIAQLNKSRHFLLVSSADKFNSKNIRVAQ